VGRPVGLGLGRGECWPDGVLEGVVPVGCGVGWLLGAVTRVEPAEPGREAVADGVGRAWPVPDGVALTPGEALGE